MHLIMKRTGRRESESARGAERRRESGDCESGLTTSRAYLPSRRNRQSTIAAHHNMLVRTPQGLLQGKRLCVEGEDYAAFLGVPYAAAPTGERRFQKPFPVECHDGILECTSFGPQCPHIDHPDFPNIEVDKSEEKCLSVNVFTAACVSEPPRPVMVFIHGGGFAIHSSAHYGETGICRNLVSRGLVVVTFNYRLGVLGFVADETCRGNVGLWDQRAALQWVRDAIGAFGGDPERVTVAGQSAGGCAADLLALSPLTRDLFQRVICMSGTAENDYCMSSVEDIRRVSRLFADAKGYQPSKGSVSDFLRTLPIDEIAIGFHGRSDFKMSKLQFVPNMDFEFFPRSLKELRKESRHLRLLGVTENEGLYFSALTVSDFLPPEVLADIVLTTAMRESSTSASECTLRGLYSDEPSSYHLLSRLFSDTCVNTGVLRCALSSPSPSFLYQFDYCNPQGYGQLADRMPFKSATHSSELRHLFDKGLINEYREDDKDRQMSELFSTVICDFVKYGNPGEEWQRYSPERPLQYHSIDIDGVRVRQNFQDGRCLTWLKSSRSDERS